MRSKRVLLNIIFSLMLEVVTIASGFIIPRLVIGAFGSSVNGLINSTSQLFGYLTLLQSGVGGVVEASLYKLLADKDIETTSGIIKSTENFFKKILYITILYAGALVFIFPILTNISLTKYIQGDSYNHLNWDIYPTLFRNYLSIIITSRSKELCFL